MKKRNFRALTFTSYAFDAMWTVALTLNKSLSEQPRFQPDNAKFADPYVAFRYSDLLAATEFEGLSVSSGFIKSNGFEMVCAFS